MNKFDPYSNADLPHFSDKDMEIQGGSIHSWEARNVPQTPSPRLSHLPHIVCLSTVFYIILLEVENTPEHSPCSLTSNSPSHMRKGLGYHFTDEETQAQRIEVLSHKPNNASNLALWYLPAHSNCGQMHMVSGSALWAYKAYAMEGSRDA